MVIDLTLYEKRSLYRFLGLYLASVFLLLAVIGYLFFQNSANAMSSAMRFEMLYQARMIESKLLMAKERGEGNVTKKFLPTLHTTRFKVAYFDKSKSPLYSQIDEVPMFNKQFYGVDNHCYSVIKFPEKDIDVGYIVLREDELKYKLHALKSKVILYLVAMFLFMAIVGYFLTRLFLRPIHDKIDALDRFIEDTTHELNTPISAILMTIQTIKGVEPKKLERLKASAKRLSTMYDTLSYSLSSDSSKKESFDFGKLLRARVEELQPLALHKHIRVYVDVESCNVHENKEAMRRLIDNVLSNAIKYSNPAGRVWVELKGALWSVRDEGIGISESDKKSIFKRYQRFNEERGGFGIGLSIVLAIAKESGIKISIDSKPGEGSKFSFDITRIVNSKMA
ncbi:MAG TPA: HAMP domain-containing histidine kinase [Nitratifractor sp.]|nr:HAMP domain-containing histidine kinase [Nitratifractor sp.]